MRGMNHLHPAQQAAIHGGRPTLANETLAGGTRVGAIQMAMASLTESAKGVLDQHSELWKRLQSVSRQEPVIGAGETGPTPSTGCQHADDIMQVVEMLQVLRAGLDYQLRALEV